MISKQTKQKVKQEPRAQDTRASSSTIVQWSGKKLIYPVFFKSNLIR